MLLYQFRCRDCRNLYEVEDKESEIECCGSIAPRVYAVGGISFKGSGWHSTDYKNKKG